MIVHTFASRTLECIGIWKTRLFGPIQYTLHACVALVVRPEFPASSVFSRMRSSSFVPVNLPP